MATKTKIRKLQGKISRLEKRLKGQRASEERSRNSWTRAYHSFNKAVVEYASLTNIRTKKAANLRVRMTNWPERSVELTQLRDKRRAVISQTENELIALRFQVAQSQETITSQRERHDVIVDQVFRLNDHVVAALTTRNEYLAGQVYSYLIDDKGNTRSQVTFDSADGLRRVVAMVNSIQLIDSTVVGEAFASIDAFFERVGAVTVNPELQPLYDLTRKLLTEKRSFKVGETFSRFISLKLTKKDFPELVDAQNLLKQAVRPEKTSSYIRLYTRDDKKSRWVPMNQS